MVVAVIYTESGSIISNKSKLCVNRGVLLHLRDSAIPHRHSLVLTETLLLRFLKAGKLKVSSGLSTTTVYLKKQDAISFFQQNSDENQQNFYSPLPRTLLMSAVFSNSLTGLLAAVPLLRKGASLLGAHQTALFLQGISLEGWLSLRGLPPLLSKISSILFACWAVGFFTEFFREYGLRISVCSDIMVIRKGLVTKSHIKIHTSNIRAIISKQSILLFLCGLYSLQVAANLSRSAKIHILSAAARLKCIDVEEKLLGKTKSDITFSIPYKALFSYTWLPLLLFLLSSLLLILLPQRFIFKIFFGITAGLCVLMFIFRVMAFYRSCISIKGRICEVKFYRGMNFLSTKLVICHINSVSLSRNIFHRFNGRCNLTISINSAKPFKVKIKHLKYSDAQKAAKMLTR